MRALLAVLLSATLAACMTPVVQASSQDDDVTEGKAKKGASKGDDEQEGDDEGEENDDDTASNASGDDDDSAAEEQAPNPVKSLSDLPGSKLFKPSKLPAPAIVMLHGSEGGSEGSIASFAEEMAGEGFVVVSLCWFDCKGLPNTINRIPLEHVINAGRWLKSTKDVNGKVGLFGWSRGAEMSLLVGSKTNLDPYSAIAVHAPSDTIVAAFDPSSQSGDVLEKGANGKQIPAPAWTWQGKPLFGEPDTTFETPGPLIDVNAYKGPLYVSQGTADEVWPVARGKHVVSQRKSDLVTKSRFFSGAKHVLTKAADIDTQRTDITTLFHSALD